MTPEQTEQVYTDLLLMRFRRHLKALKRSYREWQEECRRDLEEGHRPHYCFHGTNQWTDYDNICGPCEDGLTLRDIAEGRARDEVRTFRRRIDVCNAANEAGAPQHIKSALVVWASEAIPPFEGTA